MVKKLLKKYFFNKYVDIINANIYFLVQNTPWRYPSILNDESGINVRIEFLRILFGVDLK